MKLRTTCLKTDLAETAKMPVAMPSKQSKASKVDKRACVFEQFPKPKEKMKRKNKLFDGTRDF